MDNRHGAIWDHRGVHGAFSQQAQNLILLAEDEARMLGWPTVEPEHLLLAITRRGNVKRLLGERGVRARDIHAAIVVAGGRGDDLVLGYVPWSKAATAVLSSAVSAAARRGRLGPGTEDLLLALDQHDGAAAVLRAVGISGVAGLGEPARERLLTVTQQALEDLQEAVAGHIDAPSPSASANGRELPPAHAVVIGDEVNPRLRLFYGDPDAPVLEMPHPALVNMLVDGWG